MQQSPLNVNYDSDYYIMGQEDEEDIFLDANQDIILINDNNIIAKKSQPGTLQILDIEGERTTLPHLRSPDQKISLWKVLKEMIGKDLSKVSLPVYFNEPLSMTQRVVESNEYCDTLLEKASYESDSLIRMAYVSAFMMSRFCTAVSRM